MTRSITCLFLSLALAACGDDVQPVADISVPQDMAVPPDLVPPADLTPVVVDMAPAVLAASYFDSSNDGWKLYLVPAVGPYDFAGGTASPIYHNTGGNPGPWIGAKPNSSDILYWEAPASFIGDKSRMYNGQLRYSLKATTGSMPYGEAEVVLVGAGMILIFPPLQEPAVAWTDYIVAFNVGSAWKKGKLDGPAPTEAEFKMVLGNLTRLRIRAEHFRSKEETGLDNVMMMTAAGM